MIPHVVISAVNIRKGGTLTILRQCLEYLSSEATEGRMKVTALVHDRSLADYPSIDYIEMPATIRSWRLRLKAEYRDMRRISETLQPVDLWFSLHDTTPNVVARLQAVYCQTSFPFYRWHWRDFLMDKKIPMFAMLTRWVYRKNVGQNSWLVVQQQWLRDGLSKMLGIDPQRFIVAPPRRDISVPDVEPIRSELPLFFYASTPDCHKNFETLLRAARLLEQRRGADSFRVAITVRGDENRYARWLYRKFSDLKSVRFVGLLGRRELFSYYKGCDCFVFPSLVETWGLPISESMVYDKPMILADLPYAHETAAGSRQTAFFPAEDPRRLADLMEQVIDRHLSPAFSPLSTLPTRPPYAPSWPALFSQLLKL